MNSFGDGLLPVAHSFVNESAAAVVSASETM
jgi:hypothetical protein